MAIKGDLWSMDLTRVFQMLSLNQNEGQLIIDLGGNRELSVLFCRSGITLLPICDLHDEETLQYVIKRRNIAGGCLLEARKKYGRFDKPLVEALKEIGLIKRSWLLPLLRERVQSRLLDLFFLTSGKFEFQEESAGKFISGLDEEEREAFFFQVEEVVMVGSQRLDEWNTIQERVPSTEEVYYAIRTPAQVGGDGMPTEMAEVLMAFNGVRSVSEVVEITGLGIFRVCGYIVDLLDERYIAAVEPKMLEQTAHNLFQNGRMDEALRLFHRLLDLTDGDPDIHLKVALIYERKSEYLHAAHHYRCLAEHHFGQGAIAQCYEYYQTVLRLIPTDIDVLGRIVGLYLRYYERCRLETFDIVKGARVLVQIHLEMKEIEKATDLLQRLVKSKIDLHQSRNHLIQLYLKHGRHEEAVVELELIGKQMLQEGTRAGAVKIYREILKLDPGRPDVVRILDDIDEDRRITRIRKCRKRSLIRSSLYLSIFFVCYLYYGNMASRELRAIDEVKPLIMNKNFDSATRRLEEFIDRFPFSMAAMEARELLESIEDQQRDHLKELKSTMIDQAAEDQRNLNLAKDAFRNARDALSRNDLVEALEFLQRANQLSVGNKEWRRAVDLEKNLNQVKSYHDEAIKLRREAETLYETGRYRQSYDLFVRLYREYPYASAAKNLRTPVLLESEPSGAMVELDGKKLDGTTPMIVRLSLGTVTHLVFSKHGYQSVEQSARGDMQPSRLAILPRRPDFFIKTKVTFRSNPCIQGDIIVIGGRGGRVVAVDLQREMVRWVEKFCGLNDKSAFPSISSRGIFTGSVDPGLFKLDMKDGQKIWRFKSGTFFPSYPVVVGETVVAGDSGGTLWCVWTGKGNVLWKQDTGAEIDSSPVHVDGVVYVGNREGRLLAYNSLDGKELARIKLKGGVTVPPAVSGNLLVVVTESGMLYALDREGLKVKWTALIDGRIRAPLVVVEERIYVAVSEGYLIRFNLQNGKQDEERFQLECNLTGAPLVRPDGIYLGGMDGRFYVLDRQTLQLRWSIDLGSPIQSSVIEWNNQIIVIVDNGTIYGFPAESS